MRGQPEGVRGRDFSFLSPLPGAPGRVKGGVVPLSGNQTVVTVFTAPWYPGHSRLMEVVDSVKEWAGDGRVSVVDVDDEFATAEEKLILALPTAVASRGDNEVKRIVGAVSEEDLKRLISRNLRRPAR